MKTITEEQINKWLKSLRSGILRYFKESEWGCGGIDQLIELGRLLEDGCYDEAYEYMNNFDTHVRELVPGNLYYGLNDVYEPPVVPHNPEF